MSTEILTLHHLFSWNQSACDLADLACDSELARAEELVEQIKIGAKQCAAYVAAVPSKAEHAVLQHNQIVQKLARELRDAIAAKECVDCKHWFVPEQRGHVYCFHCWEEDLSE